MRSFYIDIELNENTIVNLPEDESKHISKVLRLKNGDFIEIFNGNLKSAKAEIIDNHHKKCKVQLIEIFKHVKDEYHIHIAIAPTKSNDRFEFFLEKATELGIHEVTPLLTENSERKVIKIDRFERIIISALKQSKRYHKPKLNELTTFEEFIFKHPNGLISHCYDKAKTTISKKEAQLNVPILIGPEGDFSISEINKALNSGYHAVDLGKTRLRTETAAIYATSILKYLNE